MTTTTSRNINLSAFLLWAAPLLLTVPNVWLAVTEQWSVLAKITNIALPLGLYLLLTSCSRKVGRTVLWCIPLMIYCAFQIVLFFLYGESIIAIDMFMNVFTTNPGEVAELLGNLLTAIACVIAIYLPLIICGIVAVCKHSTAQEGAILKARRVGIELTALGAALLTMCYIAVPGYRIERQLFPVNVIYNNVAAANRVRYIAEYPSTSADFSYHATTERPDSLREVYVMVIGETSRATNWQLAGYRRPTNPELSMRDDLIFFDHAVSESNTTHKSVPMILSYLDANTFGDSIYNTKGIISAFNEVGYATAFHSNQRRNHSFIEFFGDEAQTVEYISDGDGPQLDGELLPRLHEYLATHPTGKLFIVLHSYGSHFNYRERYPAEFEYFTPADRSEASKENRPTLINAYDNSIRYTDHFLASVIAHLDSLDCPSAMIYLADHGEDIFDDERERFLHASPTPTYGQLHVPLLVWTSAEHRSLFPELSDNALKHRELQVSSTSSAFPTMLRLAGIASPYLDAKRALTDSVYAPQTRVYVTDHNEGVPLTASGLRTPDYTQFAQHGLKL